MNEEQQRLFEQLTAQLMELDPPVDQAASVPEEFGDVPIRALLYALLRYDASPSQAHNAIARIRSSVVDLNEFRIAYPDEIAGILGPRFPMVLERSERIRAVLCAVFNNEHEISLASLYELPKREARVYLEKLDGITPYAAHRVGLCVFAAHCFPVDTRLAEALIEADIFDKGSAPGAIAGVMERAIRATESHDLFLRLEAWAEAGGEFSGRGGKRTKKSDEPKASATKGE